MKINNECARKILIEIEKIPYGETLVVWKLQEAMPEFAIEDILAIVTAFNREHYITVLDKVSIFLYGFPQKALTFPYAMLTMFLQKAADVSESYV